MALKSTVYKAQLNVADMDRDYYADHSLTLACHPSETEERLMVRVLAFALHASDSLQFTRGLSSEDEPDLWQKDMTGAVEHWIELGMPDESRIRKGCHRAERMTVLSYGDRAPAIWWEKIRGGLLRFDNLSVLHLAGDATQALAEQADRNMTWQVTIQDGTLWVIVGDVQIEVAPTRWR
ncbi:MAG: YaeQ family protein [Perlucidibaca sp.]